MEQNKTMRRKTRQIHVGNVAIGGDAPIAVQSMTTTYTRDVDSTVAQIYQLARPARLARSAGRAAINSALSHQSPAGSAKSFNDARADERVSELPLSIRRKTRVRSDHHL